MRTALMVAAADGSLAAVRPLDAGGRGSCLRVLACAMSMRMAQRCGESWLAVAKRCSPTCKERCARGSAAALLRGRHQSGNARPVLSDSGQQAGLAVLAARRAAAAQGSIVGGYCTSEGHTCRAPFRSKTLKPGPQVKLLVEEGHASPDSTDRSRLGPHDMHPACP